jgi:choline dehydrogenase-like flavoprotein
MLSHASTKIMGLASTTDSFDVIIVGSGPAGVSAAFPLLEAGLNVLMVDGGQQSSTPSPTEDFLTWRQRDSDQFNRMVGKGFYALKYSQDVTPKMRIPSLSYVFEDFEKRNQIKSNNFSAIGSLSTGGLSNAWGCGVSEYSASELCAFPFAASELALSYQSIAKRIGVSGGDEDDLQAYLGLGNHSQPPITLDKLNKYLYARYLRAKSQKRNDAEFLLGRSRVAILSQNKDSRLACNLCSNCLWGCSRKSLYSAADEISSLQKYINFTFSPGFIVSTLQQEKDHWKIVGSGTGDCNNNVFVGRKILLAAGTLATTRIALSAMGNLKKVKILSCPTAAFLLWLPKFLGSQCDLGLGTSQLSYQVSLKDGLSGFGSTFSTTGIPRSELVKRLPLKTPNGFTLLKDLLPSCIIGNLFLPGQLSKATAGLVSNGTLQVDYEPNDLTSSLMFQAQKILSTNFRKLGAIMLPGSFSVGSAGSDIHYSGSLPMKQNPSAGECHANGELETLKGVYAIDASSLPYLSEKPHTLTVMANADRIAREIVKLHRPLI